MVSVLQAASLWQQICNFFFLTSGVFNDLLVIRVALTLANAFLLVTGLLGHLSWGESVHPQGRIALDTVVWAALNLLMHGLSVIRILYDERKVELTDDQEALWRYIYRHSGLSRVQFQAILCPHVELVEFRRGDRIPVNDKFFIVLDGVVAAHVNQVGTRKTHFIPIVSGQMFPLHFM
jgi:Popeye protein conserved region